MQMYLVILHITILVSVSIAKSLNLTSNIKVSIPYFIYLVFIHNSQSDGTISGSVEVWQAVQMWNER